jgi:hypothetical protein
MTRLIAAIATFAMLTPFVLVRTPTQKTPIAIGPFYKQHWFGVLKDVSTNERSQIWVDGSVVAHLRFPSRAG